MDARQESVDAFYAENGPCCAGCDWWAYSTPGAGECRKAAPVSGEQRASLLGMHGYSCHIGSGHPFTPRNHVCGDFRDTFDWSSLPIGYLAKIGGRHLRSILTENAG